MRTKTMTKPGRTKRGSIEHFRQVTTAHCVLPWGNCRCGARVGNDVEKWRDHIEQVWRPHALPDGFRTV